MYNPEKSYYINEVAKLSQTSSGTAQRELDKFAKSGLLKKEKVANLAYFKIDQTNPLLPDIKNIINKTIGLDQILKQNLSEIKKIDFAFIFGSYAKGGFKPDSDIDLYVIGDMNIDILHKKIQAAEKQINHAINYHISALDEFKKNLKKSFFHKEITSNYILIIGNENEFKQFIG